MSYVIVVLGDEKKNGIRSFIKKSKMAQLIVPKTITQAVNEKHLTHEKNHNPSTTELLKFLTYSSWVI